MDFSETILQAWQPFFMAQLGAAATLGGLVFVGLSLNLNKILACRAADQGDDSPDASPACPDRLIHRSDPPPKVECHRH
jgi:hypothetical protein